MLVSSRAVPAPFFEPGDGHRHDGAGLILLFLALKLWHRHWVSKGFNAQLYLFSWTGVKPACLRSALAY